jgi:DNA-binding transcriptional regulator YdaS (Cro superfamily)
MPVFKLKRGAQTKIAKRLNLDLSHVGRVIKGERNGSPRLMRAIEREAVRFQKAEQRRNAA